MIFLKLGGSLITDKSQAEVVRADVLERVAAEIAAARPDRLLLGHGSGSFGHLHGTRHGTRAGVKTPAQWRGFADVSDAALRLNRLVVGSLLRAGLTAVTISPSASAIVSDGRLEYIAVDPLKAALAAGIVPVVHGDVAFDRVRGGTILSTEEVFAALLGEFKPGWLLLAGETEGVYGKKGRTIPLIDGENLAEIEPALGGSRGYDVTGGMAAKVSEMLALVQANPGLRIRIFSGLVVGAVQKVLSDPERPIGTEIAP